MRRRGFRGLNYTERLYRSDFSQVTYVTCVTCVPYVTCVTCVTYVTYVTCLYRSDFSQRWALSGFIKDSALAAKRLTSLADLHQHDRRHQRHHRLPPLRRQLLRRQPLVA